MYRANAKLALDVIENAIESTARVRKLQFEGEEQARSMQKKAARRAAEAGDVPSLMAAGQSTTQEAIEQSMAYWGQMFDLVVEIQKRLFALMEDQMSGVPGVKKRRWR
jgi:phasin family protein